MIKLRRILEEVKRNPKGRLNEAKLPPATDEIVRKTLGWKYKKPSYTINKDGSVDFNGDVHLELNQEPIPYVINSCNNLDLTHVSDFTGLEKCKIKGDLWIDSCNGAKSFKGLPSSVGGSITLGNNNGGFSSLKGMPTAGKDILIIGCSDITNLVGVQSKVNGDFIVRGQGSYKLSSLKGIPNTISGNFEIQHFSSLKEIDSLPDKVGGHIIFQYNGVKVSEFDLTEISPKLNNNKFIVDFGIKERLAAGYSWKLNFTYASNGMPNTSADNMKVLSILPQKNNNIQKALNDIQSNSYEGKELKKKMAHYAESVRDAFDWYLILHSIHPFECNVVSDSEIEIGIVNAYKSKRKKLMALGFQEQ